MLLLLTRFKDGKILENTGTVYEITNLKKEDEGQYACRAASLGGKVFSRLASLVVKGQICWRIYIKVLLLFPKKLSKSKNVWHYCVEYLK